MKDALGKVVRKTLTKKEALKLKPGMLVRVCWLDGSDSIHLVLEKPSRTEAFPSIETWTREERGYDRRTVSYDQVVEVVGEVDFEIDEATSRMKVFTKHGQQVIPLN